MPFIPRHPPSTARRLTVYDIGDTREPPIHNLDQYGIEEVNPNDQSMSKRVVDVDDTNPNVAQSNRMYTPPTGVHEYHVIKAGTNFNRQIGFLARSVRISNYTSSWAWIETLNEWVQPNWIGIVYQIPSGTQNGKVTWEAPPNRNQPAAQTSEELHITWLHDFMMPSPGAQCPNT